MTLPSLSHTDGSGNRARCSCSAMAAVAGKLSPRVCSKGLDGSLKVDRVSRLSRRADKSRGRALPRAMRAAMRSRSAMVFRLPESSVLVLSASRAATASNRAWMWSRLRRGWCSHWASRRLPMWVAQLSSVENRVGAFLPDRVAVISRLRRVAASKAMY